MIARHRVLIGMFAAALAVGPASWAADQDPPQPAAEQDALGPGEEGPAWSEVVNGLQARIELKHLQVINGTPVLATSLYLRNAKFAPNSMQIAWASEKMTFRVVDAAGKDVRFGFQGSLAYDGPGVLPLDLLLPYKGTLSFDITHQGMAGYGDQVASIDLGPEYCWVLSKENGPCSLCAVLEIADGKVKDPLAKPWHGRLELPPVPIPTAVAPLDPAMADKWIAQWGEAMIQADGHNSQEAARRLSLVADRRVIPWYVKAMDMKIYDRKMGALDRLARFDGDEALAGLKKGISTTAADIGNCDSEKLAGQLAENVCIAAAQAVARNPDPAAQALLLGLWDDPSPGVRGTVVQALAKIDSAESTALLNRLSDDPKEIVRREAKRYLELRAAKPAKPPGEVKTTEP